VTRNSSAASFRAIASIYSQGSYRIIRAQCSGAEKHDVFSLTIERKPISGRTVFLTQPEQQPELKLSSNRRNSRTNKSKNKKADLVFHYFFKYCSPTQCNHAQNTTLASLCTPPRILYAGNLRISYAERRKIFALYHSLIS